MSDARVADRYEPVEVVGRGGEATVLKAIDTRHDRFVALKVRTAPTTGSSEDALAETRALLTLPAHPGLAHARDDLFDRGRHVLVLDWVEGVNLARVLADEGRPGLPVTTVLRWAAQTADALAVLHQHGVVHGDVKPANLIVDDTGHVVLVDLGSSSVPRTETRGGGTPGFRAPEIAAGEPADRRSDVFGLAATVLTLLTGEPPRGGPPAWTGVTIERPVRDRLQEALRAGLSIDPARRPATPGELVDRLRAGWDDRTPTGVGTVLLTDVVGSTALWEHAPHRVPALLAEMQLVIDRCVESNGGSRFGTTIEGDATMSVFNNALDAVTAATELQRDLAGRPEALRVRVGLATGELVEVDGDYLGPTVNRAARVREYARAGEILLSASTAAVVRGALPDGVTLSVLGTYALRGVEAPEEITAVTAPGVAAPPDPTRSPYPGLAPYSVADADLFVGRDDAIARCLSLLADRNFVAIVGASGSGKSSLAMAGIATRLRDAIVIRPGQRPMDALAAADLSGHPAAALVVDQLEEVVTLCPDPAERADFVRAVLGHPGGVVITVRADLYGEFAAFSELAERLASSQVLLGPLGRDDVMAAVREPAVRCGLDVEAGLPELVADELGDAPGALPLLGHALREAWVRRDGRTITCAGYRAAGGVRSAIATTADRALAGLDADHLTTVRRVLLSMVELREDGYDARRWVSREELVDIDPHRADDVLAALVAARLLVVDGDSVTVAHEALMRAWSRLGDWITEERADLLALQEVRQAARRWDESGRNEADLFRGARLDAAVDLARRVSLPRQPNEFVEAGTAVRDRERRDARRRTRRLRALATVASVLAILAVAVGVVALAQRNEARDARSEADVAAEQAAIAAQQADAAAANAEAERDAAQDAQTRADESAQIAEAERDAAQEAQQQAEQERRTAVSRELASAADANLTIDPERSVLLALAAIAETREADGTVVREAEETLHRAVGSRRVEQRFPGLGGAVDWSPAGDVVVAEAAEHAGFAELRDLDTGAAIELLHAEGHDITGVAFSADGVLVATTGSDGVARLWDAVTGTTVATVAGSGSVSGPSFSPDGRGFAAAWTEEDGGRVRVVDIGSGDLIRQVEMASATTTEFDSQGRRLLVGSHASSTVLVVDLMSGDAQNVETGHRSGINDVSWSPDGSLIATASNDGSVRVFDAATGRYLFSLLGHSGGVAAIDWNHGSDLILTGSDDGTAKVWSVLEDDGREMASMSAHDTRSGVVSVAFSPDGTRAITGDEGMTAAIVWDVSAMAGAEVANLPAVLFHPGAAAFSPAGDRLFTSLGGGELGEWDPEDWSLVKTFAAQGGEPVGSSRLDSGQWTNDARDIVHIAVSPTEDRVAIVRATGDGRVEVWDAEHGRQVFVVDTDEDDPPAAWSPDGEHLAVVDGSRRRVTIFDAEGSEVAHTTYPDAWWIGSVQFGPDGDGVLMAAEPDDVVYWNWRTGRTEYRIGSSTNRAVLSPSGDLVAVKPRDDTELRNVEVFDARTQALIATLEGQTGQVNDLAFSPDGRLVATASGDGSIRVWEARTGDSVLVLPGHPATSDAVSFSTDGRWLASYGAEGVVRVWALDLDELIEIAERSLTRQFTDEECREFLRAPSCA